MKSFDVKKIRLKSKKNEPSIEEKLAGNVITELKTPLVEPNAELEGEEVVKFPDGTIQVVKGNPHSKGGVKMNIPDGTLILSRVLNLNKKDVKSIKDNFEIDLSTKDSYAKAMQKYDSKIGLKALNSEQEEIIKKIKKQIENRPENNTTFLLNQQYLSEKVNEIEKQKAEKEEARQMFFDFVFNRQEQSKSEDKKMKADQGKMKYGGLFGMNTFEDGGEQDTDFEEGFDISEISLIDNNAIIPSYSVPFRDPFEVMAMQEAMPQEPQQFKNGGQKADNYNGLSKDRFQKLISKYGLSENQGLELLNSGTIRKYQDAGVASQTVKYLVQNPDGSYSLYTQGANGPTVELLPQDAKLETQADGSIGVTSKEGTFKYPLYKIQEGSDTLIKVSKDEESKAVDQVLSELGLLPKNPEATQTKEEIKTIEKTVSNNPGGMTKDQYAQLLSTLNSPTKVAEAYSKGQIDFETASKLNYDIENPKQPILFKTSEKGKHAYSNSDEFKRVRQHRSDAAFGNITEEDIPYVMQYMYRNFPDIVAGEDIFGITYDPKTKSVTWNKNLDFSKKLDQVKRYQEKGNIRMKASARVMLDNPGMFDPTAVKNAERFLNEETFAEGLTARGFDAALGNFSSGRYNLDVDAVTPEELEALSGMGIYTVNQLYAALAKDPELISQASKDRIELLKGMMSDDADFVLNTYEIPKVEEEEPAPEIKEEKIDILDDIITNRPKLPTRYNIPKYYPLPPSPLQAHLFTDTR